MLNFVFIAQASFIPFHFFEHKPNKMAIYRVLLKYKPSLILASFRALLLCAYLFFAIMTPAYAVFSDTTVHLDSGKEVRIPVHLSTVPDNNDFHDTASEYCYQRSVEGKDIIIFWSKQYGQNPLTNPDTLRRFDAKRALKECEWFYRFYVDSLQLVRKKGGVIDKYKVIFLVVGGTDNTAYGWGQDSVGVLWTPASRMSQYPYGVLAHELGHAFQYLSSLDYAGKLDGPITEMAAQYLLWQVYPGWLTFENYHLKAFMQQTHLAFEHPANMYHSPFMLEYWSEKYGKTFYSQLLHQAKKGEDIVAVFKRIRQMDQEAFNDDMFAGVRHFITWDLPRIRKVAAPYVNQHETRMVPEAGEWYRADTIHVPQNYGYNAIRLQVPDNNLNEIALQFKGLVINDTAGGKKIPAGWRYGFVAYTREGGTYYSDIGSNSHGHLSYVVPKGTAYLWLVVMGAPGLYVPPVRHHKKSSIHYCEWPYAVKLEGTDIFPSRHSI